MAQFKEYTKYDALGLAELVRQKQITAKELVEAAVSQIEKHNPQLNAVVNKFYDEAEKQIQQASPSSPFFGVPFLLKDLGAAYQGQPLTGSCQFGKDYRPKADSDLVIKYKKAGFIILGQTNTPEFGIMGITESQLRGPCRNPWSLNHSPGGSSGGAGAAVASGMVPVAHAGDGGGSIRIPASACNLVGLKPSRGLVPFGPYASESWMGLVCLHSLSRTVRDSAALLDIEKGYSIGTPYAAPSLETSFSKPLKPSSQKLKIAVSTDSILGQRLDPQCFKAVEKTAQVLKELGHEVVFTTPQFDKEALKKAYMIIVTSSVALEIKNLSLLQQRKPKAEDFEPLTWFLNQVSASFTSYDLSWALDQCRKVGRQLGEFFTSHDLFVLSTLGQLPSAIGSYDLSVAEKLVFQTLKVLPQRSALHAVLYQMSHKGFESATNTQVFNMAGNPAISLPLAMGNDKGVSLPIGIQFAAAFGKDDLLFDIAAQLEETSLWQKQKPPLY